MPPAPCHACSLLDELVVFHGVHKVETAGKCPAVSAGWAADHWPWPGLADSAAHINTFAKGGRYSFLLTITAVYARIAECTGGYIRRNAMDVACGSMCSHPPLACRHAGCCAHGGHAHTAKPTTGLHTGPCTSGLIGLELPTVVCVYVATP
jgi:hypothetical protein